MIIGVAREIKRHEYRVAMTPAGMGELVADGHTCLLEEGAGAGSGFDDGAYRRAGGEVTGRDELFARAELLVKVKEPIPSEYGLLRPGQLLFTYLHLAPNPELTEALVGSGVTALAYETLRDRGGLPLLAPMSEIAGRMAPLAGAWAMQSAQGGCGILPPGAVGVPPARALILGGGTVGGNAARVALGLGMETVVLNHGLERLQRLDDLWHGRVRTLLLTQQALSEELGRADLVIGAVLVPGGRTPLLIGRSMLAEMKRGAVIVDVAVDQGGCAETTRPTCHDDPVYLVDGIVHYAVANMPGAYPRTATMALTSATLPYIRRLASGGHSAIDADPVLGTAVNVRAGRIVHPALAAAVRAHR
jgi:alanine dehydrogenase